VEFESANTTIVKSIKQRDLLNTGCGFCREQLSPHRGIPAERFRTNFRTLCFTRRYRAGAAALVVRERRSDVERLCYTGKGDSRRYLGPRLVPVVIG